MIDAGERLPPREILRSVGVWLLLAGLIFALDATVTLVREIRIAERHVRLVRESRVRRIRHQGRIYTQDGIARHLRRRPFYLALPHLLGALLLAGCLALSFWRPRAAVLAALGVLAVGAPLALALRPGIRAEHVLYYLFVLLLLLLGLRSAWGRPLHRS